MITEINSKELESEVMDGFIYELKLTVCNLIVYTARV